MKKWICLIIMTTLLTACAAKITPKGDVYKTPKGDMYVDLLGHGSLAIYWAGNVILVDPFSQVTDYAKQPKADLVLITHDHSDHLDPMALNQTLKKGTHIIANQAAADQIKDLKPQVLKNGEKADWKGLRIDAVPAYNQVHKQPNGQLWHAKGNGNGYVLYFGTFALYIAGDTENIPEMKKLKDIDVAFLPKNLPYTMTDDMFIQAAKDLNPKVLYPYHYETADKPKLQQMIGEKTKIK